MVCILGMGDCGTTTEVKNKFNMSMVQKNIFEQTSKNSQKVSASATAAATFKIEIENVNAGCPVNIIQTVKAEAISKVDQVLESMTEVISNVTTDIQNAADTELKNTKGWLALSGGDRTSLQTEMNTALENITKRTFSSENIQNVGASAVSIANGVLTIKNCNAPINVQQDVVAQSIAEAMIESLTENIVNDTQLNEVITKMNTKIENEQTGFFESIGKMFKSMTGFWIILGLVTCVLLVVLMKVALSPAGQKAIESGGGKAPKR